MRRYLQKVDQEKNNMSESIDDDLRTRAVCDFFGKVFFSVSNPPEDLEDLCDGVVMFEALSEM